jgi:putative glutamine amidotransferase
MKPIIGITGSIDLVEKAPPKDTYRLRMRYIEAIERAHGCAVILPAANDANVNEILGRLDGLILSGGSDIPYQVLKTTPHPSCTYLPMARWDSDVRWLDTARKLHLPVLGICLGMQIMNVVAGGSIIQDIPTMCPNAGRHAAPDEMFQHTVELTPDSKVASFARTKYVAITSAHHQAIDRVGDGYVVTAKSPDGLIEAIEYQSEDFCIGVQWHPERCLDQPNWLLEGFVKVCGVAHT